jgi:prepilin-type N-terminal cleavage/methylation domain-containing protein
MNKKTSAFTIIELIVVVSIVGVLSTIGIVSYSRIRANARDSARASKVNIMAEALEKYYDKNGEYPSCNAMSQNASTLVTSTLVGMDPNVLTAPTAATGTDSLLPACAEIGSTDAFAYIGDTSTPCLTGTGQTSACAQFTLKYREESSGQIVAISGSHWNIAGTFTLTIIAGTGGTVNTGGTYNVGTTQTITATHNVGYEFVNWTGSTGCLGAESHTITIDANKTCTANFIATYALTIAAGANGTVNTAVNGIYNSGDTPTIIATPSTHYEFSSWSGGGNCPGTQTHTILMNAAQNCTANFTIINYVLSTSAGTGGSVIAGGIYNSGTTQTITATPATYYDFTSWTGSAGCSGIAIHTIYMDGAKNCVASFTPTPISTPTMTTVSNSSNTTTTTWTWPAVTCTGNTARYQYQYSYEGYTSSWTGPQAGTSVAKTTANEGYNYSLAVQAQCYNTATTSSWSASNISSYIRPVSSPTMPAATTPPWTITRLNGNHVPPVTVQLSTTASCGTGVLLYSMLDMYTESWAWSPSGLNGWLSDVTGGSHAGATGWWWGMGYRGTTMTVASDSNTNDIPTGKKFKESIVLKCVNQTTSRESATTSVVAGEGLLLSIP